MGNLGKMEIEKIYPEEIVIKFLISNSPEFKAYYEAERDKITIPITWVRKLDLPEGIDYRTSEINKKQFIYLRRIPPNIKDSLKIAHELQHVIHREQGIPLLGVLNANFENLSSAFNSCIHDLLVNRDLLKYDFDLCDDFEQEIVESKRQLEKISQEPTEFFELLRWAVNYASKQLDYSFIISEYDYQDDTFFRWFDRRYPRTAMESFKIVTAINKIGIKSTESIITNFDWFISEYKLSRIMKL